MDRLAKALIVGLIVLAMYAPGAAQQGRRGEVFQSRDCGKGTVEERLACLNSEIIQIKRRMEGREGRITPLQQ